VSAVGGEPELVIEGATSAALHPRDGRFVFARGGRLWMLDPPLEKGRNEPQPFAQSQVEGTIAVRAFSPDGTKLPVVKDRTVWLLAYPDGAAREVRVSDHRQRIQGEENPPFGLGSVAWMPDSRHYVTEMGQPGRPGFAMVDTDSLTYRTILRSPTPLLNPSVSPDGTRLAYTTGDGRWRLVEVTLADGRVRELGSGIGISWFPSLGPDGARLAFSDGPEPPLHIREMTLAPAGEVVARPLPQLRRSRPSPCSRSNGPQTARASSFQKPLALAAG
jgi:hypothetical protein